jgi:hypothetical protein
LVRSFHIINIMNRRLTDIISFSTHHTFLAFD